MTRSIDCATHKTKVILNLQPLTRQEGLLISSALTVPRPTPTPTLPQPNMTCSMGPQPAPTLKEELSPPLDLSHHFSRVTQKRHASAIKAFYKYFAIPGIGNLAGGRLILLSPILFHSHNFQAYPTHTTFPTILLKPRQRSPTASSLPRMILLIRQPQASKNSRYMEILPLPEL